MKKNLPFLLAILYSLFVSAQSIEINWSEQFIYDNKIDGFFDGYLGTNSTYVYGKFSNLALNPKKSNNKIKLLAFDKNTMKKVGDVELKGYGQTDSDLEYYKTIVLSDVVYVVWTKERKGNVEIYIQSFDSKLKKLNKVSKIYEYSDNKKTGHDHFAIVSNKQANNRILLIKEFDVLKDEENLKIEYRVLNSDLSFESTKQVTLPILITKKRKGLFKSANVGLVCTYEFGSDGNIYVQDVIKMSDEEKKSLKKGETSSYPYLAQIETETGRLKDYKVKFSRKNTFKFSTLISKDQVKLYGFFSDLDKDEKGNDTHGIFYVSIDSKGFTVTESNFAYFDKTFLDALFAADKENQKKGKGLFKSKKAKESDNESIDDEYVIEQTIMDGNDIVLFCSIMNNWQRTVCTTNSNGGTTCNTYYYCTKSNVTSFKLNQKGDIVWAKNLDRLITYSGWNIYDVSVVKKDDNYYVLYGSAYQINASKKNRSSKKSTKQLTDRLEYAVFASKTGDFKKSEYQINGLNSKKSTSKQVDESGISVYDNKMYTSCMRVKIKPTTFIACLCPPVFYALLFSGNSRKGTGYLGTITPIK